MTGPNLVGARLIPLPAPVALTGPPNLPFFFSFFSSSPLSPKIRARETPASHAGVCLGETVCVGVEGGAWSGFVSVERSPLLRGVGRWNGVVKAAVSQLITAANFAELENRGGSKGWVERGGKKKKSDSSSAVFD